MAAGAACISTARWISPNSMKAFYQKHGYYLFFQNSIGCCGDAGFRFTACTGYDGPCAGFRKRTRCKTNIGYHAAEGCGWGRYLCREKKRVDRIKRYYGEYGYQ